MQSRVTDENCSNEKSKQNYALEVFLGKLFHSRNQKLLHHLLFWWETGFDYEEYDEDNAVVDILNDIKASLSLSDQDILITFKNNLSEEDMIAILDVVLINNPIRLLDHVDDNDWTPAFIAMHFGKIKIFEYLLSKETERITSLKTIKCDDTKEIEKDQSEEDLPEYQYGIFVTHPNDIQFFDQAFEHKQPKCAFLILEHAQLRKLPPQYYYEILKNLFHGNTYGKELENKQFFTHFVDVIKIILSTDINLETLKYAWELAVTYRNESPLNEKALIQSIVAILNERLVRLNAKKSGINLLHTFYKIAPQNSSIYTDHLFVKELIAKVLLSFDDYSLFMLTKESPTILKYLIGNNNVVNDALVCIYNKYLLEKDESIIFYNIRNSFVKEKFYNLLKDYKDIPGVILNYLKNINQCTSSI